MFRTAVTTVLTPLILLRLTQPLLKKLQKINKQTKNVIAFSIKRKIISIFQFVDSHECGKTNAAAIMKLVSM